MAISPEQTRDNPWWGNREAVQNDPHLRRLRDVELVFEHPIPFDLDTDAVYTLRGPRQVGKTTLLKRIIQFLITSKSVAPRNVMYLDVEGANIREAYDLQVAIREYLDWKRVAGDAGRAYILLDEITGVESWGTAIRVLHGRGDLDEVTLMCTGSHARDVKRGAERAPGRKGAVEAWDWIMMPLSFRDYIALHAPEVAEDLPSFNLVDPATAREAAAIIELHQATIHPLFSRYLLTGGFPHAFSSAARHGEIPARVYRLYQEAIRGELVRAGHREDLFRELVSWIASGRFGEEFNWSSVSGGTSIGSHHTAREYLEDAQAAFAWHIIFRLKTLRGPTPAPRSPKKLYPADPFTRHVLVSWVHGGTQPWADSVRTFEQPAETGGLVESVVGDHLRRWRGPFTLYHRAARGAEEIDFVVFDGSDRGLVEVKYRNTIRPQDKRSLRKYGGGILVTKRDLFWNEDNNVAGIPAPTFLAGLAAPLTIFPSVE